MSVADTPFGCARSVSFAGPSIPFEERDMAYQRPLIPISPEETLRRARHLAQLTLELRDLQDEHADRKKDMANAERELATQIRRLARSIHDGVDEPE
jgi:signal transduction histidine kinase